MSNKKLSIVKRWETLYPTIKNFDGFKENADKINNLIKEGFKETYQYVINLYLEKIEDFVNSLKDTKNKFPFTDNKYLECKDALHRIYFTIAEHENKEIIIDTIDEFNTFLFRKLKLNSSEEITSDQNRFKAYYRGVSKDTYKLTSTLEREIKKHLKESKLENDEEFKREFESLSQVYLNKCKHLLRGKISDQYILTDEEFTNELWAVGQHFGLKTPLTDWSLSFPIALFFAFREKLSQKDETRYRLVYQLDLSFNKTEDEEIIISSRIDIGGRMNAQKGVFTNLLEYEYALLEEKYNNELNLGSPILVKIKINSKLRNYILNFLREFNIRDSTLFPDITGSINDCHIELSNILDKWEEL